MNAACRVVSVGYSEGCVIVSLIFLISLPLGSTWSVFRLLWCTELVKKCLFLKGLEFVVEIFFVDTFVDQN